MEEEGLFGLLMGGVHCWGRFVLYLDRGGHGLGDCVEGRIPRVQLESRHAYNDIG